MKNSDPDFFDLNPHKLDEEWLAQPRLYRKYALELADARAEWERAKANRDVVEANLDKHMRADPATFEIVKVTDKVIEKAIITRKPYQRANAQVLAAKHRMDILQATVDALDHRKRALEGLVHLHLSSYYAEPRAGKFVDKEQVSEMKKKVIRSKGRQANAE